MPFPPDDILIQRLEQQGERLTWAINSTVYLLGGTRFIVWMKLTGGLEVAPLPPRYGPDHYEAAVSFMLEIQERARE
jgi:hypothetical protein